MEIFLMNLIHKFGAVIFSVMAIIIGNLREGSSITISVIPDQRQVWFFN
jgi:hypothetical protein